MNIREETVEEEIARLKQENLVLQIELDQMQARADRTREVLTLRQKNMDLKRQLHR